jgi:phasin family protein
MEKEIMSTNKKNTKDTAPVDAVVNASKEAVETVVKAGADAATKNYEQAVALTQEQVDVAAKAGADAYKGYEDFAAFGKSNLEAFVESGNILTKGVQDISKMWVGLTQSSLEGSVSLTQEVLKCKNLQELAEVQNTLAKESYENLVAEGQSLSNKTAKLAEDTLAPLSARVDATLKTFVKPLAA